MHTTEFMKLHGIKINHLPDGSREVVIPADSVVAHEVGYFDPHIQKTFTSRLRKLPP